LREHDMNVQSNVLSGRKSMSCSMMPLYTQKWEIKYIAVNSALQVDISYDHRRMCLNAVGEFDTEGLSKIITY
jgi:hypothetical protein